MKRTDGKNLTFTATLPDGRKVTRSSKTMTYTHAIIGRSTWVPCEYGAEGDNGNGWKKVPPKPFGVLQWSMSEGNALKAVGTMEKRGFVEVQIIAVGGK